MIEHPYKEAIDFMKRYCKGIDITDKDLIYTAVVDCLAGKKNRRDVKALMQRYETVDAIVATMQEEIRARNLQLKPMWYSIKEDSSSGKIRQIGIQDIKQQLYDYVAVYALRPAFARIGEYQCAAIPGRGQIYGLKAIQKWLRNPGIKYACKLDIRRCYESIDRGLLMDFLHRHIKNDPLLWLVHTLIATFDRGLSIGSYLSQYLCNLYLSDLYHEIAENMYKLRGRKRGCKRVNLVHHVLFYMDDILLLGTSAKDMNAAAKRVIAKAAAMGLEVKPDWRTFRIADEKGSSGGFIDMMGFRFYRKYTTIRSRVFLRLRRAFLRARRRRTICLRTAQRCIAYFGFVLHTSSFTIAHKYKMYKIIRIAKEVISRESKIPRAAAACAVG